METVCEGKEWDVALAYANDGEVTGALPYLIGSKFGMRYIVQPQLTQYNGPWYRYPKGLSVRKQLQFQYSVDEQLMEHINRLNLAFFSQNFSPNAYNWLPFHWAGYKQTTRYSFRFDPIPNEDGLLELMIQGGRRKKIKKLMPVLMEDYTVSPDEFTRFYMGYWNTRGKRCLMKPDFVKVLCDRAISRGNGLIVGLRERDTEKLAGVKFLVYDSNCAYSLMSAFERKYDVAGISECLVWVSINKLSKLSRVYDFEGSMDKGIEYFYRSFGATPIAYHHVWKVNNPLLKPFWERLGI